MPLCSLVQLTHCTSWHGRPLCVWGCAESLNVPCSLSTLGGNSFGNEPRNYQLDPVWIPSPALGGFWCRAILFLGHLGSQASTVKKVGGQLWATFWGGFWKHFYLFKHEKKLLFFRVVQILKFECIKQKSHNAGLGILTGQLEECYLDAAKTGEISRLIMVRIWELEKIFFRNNFTPLCPYY